jgi:2,4-dienoyl-CoA reductase-like NADH-dependent reductase (Old Yellow Enzyme family)
VELQQSVTLGACRLKNRILRSATYEGMCDASGFPSEPYFNLYQTLSKSSIGGIITGFTYISRDGRAMQPGQAGIECDDKIAAYKKVTEAVHANGCKIFMQLAHCGRQTTKAAVGGYVYGVSTKKSAYFKAKPKKLSQLEIHMLVEKFAEAAYRAKCAGFDGVQIHAAHGYLLHQFILPVVNNRNDIFGIDPKQKIGTAFLNQVIDAIRLHCGMEYPLLIKISAGVDYFKTFTLEQFIRLVRFLDKKHLGGIEISYGTMDYALNIFRGTSFPEKQILKVNPRYSSNNAAYRFVWKHFIVPYITRKFKPFTPMYNLAYAALAKEYTNTPVICVGGFRTAKEMSAAIESNHTDFVSLCRPFICEPDFADKISRDPDYESQCKNCNQCAIMCDAAVPTKCYHGNVKNLKK